MGRPRRPRRHRGPDPAERDRDRVRSRSPKLALDVSKIAVLAWHLFVPLDPADLVENTHRAYRHPILTQTGYAVVFERLT